MSADAKTSFVLTTMAVVFLGLAAAFREELWGKPEPITDIPQVDPSFTNTATVRVSASQLKRSGGDTSSLECNTCHEPNKPPKIKMDANDHVILPKEHEDLVMRHGRLNRNDYCFNCHDPANLEMLRTREGRQLKIEDSTKLCASCHGPTYRDWEVGVHGRVSGKWTRDPGQFTREDCVSCHHPHSPAFAPLKPAPGPHALHPTAAKGKEIERLH